MLTPGDGSDLKGISSTHRGGCLHHEQKEIPEQVSRQVSPTKTRYFSHKLFSITPSPNQTEGQRAGAGDDSHNFPSNIGEIEPSPTTAHSRKRRLLQVTRTPLPVDGSRQGNHVTHQGQDTAMVTRAGFACSEQVLAGYVAQMNGGDNNAVSLGTTTIRNSERFISLQLPQEKTIERIMERRAPEWGNVVSRPGQDNRFDALGRKSVDPAEAFSRAEGQWTCDVPTTVREQATYEENHLQHQTGGRTFQTRHVASTRSTVL